VAAIIARQMERSVLVTAFTSSGQDERALAGALEEVGQAHLLMETGEGRYQFLHDLIREVVLADLSALQRRHWHAQIAAVLEQTPGELPVEQLAYHYSQTDDHQKAILYLERAGDRAKTLSAHMEAESAYRALLAQLGRLDRPLEAARVCRKLNRVLSAQARYDEALALLEQAAEHYRLANDPAGQWRTLAQIGYEHFYLGAPQAGLARLEPWLASVRQAGLPEVQAIFQSCLGALYIYTLRFREALSQSEEALTIAHTLRQARRVRQVTLVHAQAKMAMGSQEEAIQALEPLVPAQEAINEEEQLTTLAVLSAPYYRTGDFPSADAALERGLEAAERMGYLMWSTLFRTFRGNQAFLRGEWRRARQDYVQALETSRHSSRSWTRVVVLLELGQLDLAEGQREDALRQLLEATALPEGWARLTMPRQLESVLAEDDLLRGQPAAARARLEAAISRFGDQQSLYEAELLPLLGWAALEASEEERAEVLIAKGIEQARTFQQRLVIVDALRIQALLRVRQQRWEEAEAALEEALALCRAMPYPWAEAKALYVSGRLELARGEQEAARERLEAALAICTRLGEGMYARHIKQALAGREG
jgi:tetratricopeptide (TPR) repeat protein